jgi:DNA-binding NarL/FixJ family response regulator
MAQSAPNLSKHSESIVIAHHHALICEGIAKILQEAGFHVVGQTDTGRGLFQLAMQHKPDIMLVDGEVSGVLQAGARGYLSVNLSSQEFVQALHMLAKGDIVVSQDMATGVKIELDADHALKSRDDISGREQEVLQLVCEGATNREIAERLIVSEHTVKVHLRNILNKLNLRNRQQVAAYAVQEGLVTDIKSDESS